jgi:hypothetical protein
MNSKARKHLKEPDKVFLTQREMAALRKENQKWPNGDNNFIFPRECASGPAGSGVPSFRRCHMHGRGFVGNKVGLSGYTFRADSKRKVKEVFKNK